MDLALSRVGPLPPFSSIWASTGRRISIVSPNHAAKHTPGTRNKMKTIVPVTSSGWYFPLLLIVLLVLTISFQATPLLRKFREPPNPYHLSPPRRESNVVCLLVHCILRSQSCTSAPRTRFSTARGHTEPEPEFDLHGDIRNIWGAVRVSGSFGPW